VIEEWRSGWGVRVTGAMLTGAAVRGWLAWRNAPVPLLSGAIVVTIVLAAGWMMPGGRGKDRGQTGTQA